MLSNKQDTINELIKRLRKLFPDARLELNFENAYQLLIAVILSAQAKDETINQITPNLFAKYPDPESLARANQPEVEEIIKKSGFYRRKAKLIIDCAKKIVQDFGGQIPDNIEDLSSLPGVGRKTAAMVLGNAMGKNEGIAVDTHVKRVSNRMGLSKSKNPDLIEKELMQLIPSEKWTFFSNALILFGRKICTAKKFDCSTCPVNDICEKNI